MIKNTAGQKVGAQLVSATDGSAFTGAVTVAVTVDAGTQATGSVGAGACTHEGNGYHTYAPAQAETNGDLIAFTFTGTGAVPQTVQVYTRGGLSTQEKADVNAEADTALADYDAPTKAELDAGLAALNDLDAAGVRAAVGLATANLDTQLGAIDDFLDTEIAAILEDTGTTLDDMVDDLEGRLTAALATALQAHALGIGRGVVSTGSTTTSIVFSTVNGTTPSATNAFYNGRHIVFTSGALALQATSITDYDGTTKAATVPAVTGAPANGDTFIIV